MSCPNTYRRKIFDRNGYKVIFLHLYKEKEFWLNHFLNYLRLFTEYKSFRLNEIFYKSTSVI